MTRSIHPAEESDLPDASRIMTEVTIWMHSQGSYNWGIDWWDLETMELLKKRAQLHMVKEDDTNIAVFCIQQTDPEIWPDEIDTNDALYLHRIAIDRKHARSGLPRLMVDWCKATALEQDKVALRLDTSHPKLIDIYSRLGFVAVGEAKWQEEGAPAYHGIKMEMKL